MLIHTGAEKLKCDLCDRAFIRKHDLKQHMLSHTQYVPFIVFLIYVVSAKAYWIVVLFGIDCCNFFFSICCIQVEITVI